MQTWTEKNLSNFKDSALQTSATNKNIKILSTNNEKIIALYSSMES